MLLYIIVALAICLIVFLIYYLKYRVKQLKKLVKCGFENQQLITERFSKEILHSYKNAITEFDIKNLSNFNSINENISKLSNIIIAKKEEDNIKGKTKKEILFSFSSGSIGDILKNSAEVIIEKDYIEINKIKFLHYAPYGLSEIFGRKDYEFGGLKNCIFIDVGANVGDSTLYAASLSNIKYVYSYEPFKSTYKSAKENIELNDILSKKIKLFNYGWYNQNSVRSMPTLGKNSALNSIDNTFKQVLLDKVDMEKLDKIDIELKEAKSELISIIQMHPHSPIILKLDIEGAEYECLENIGEVLKYVDVVLVEWHFRGYDTIVSILENNNFMWFNEVFMPRVGLIRAYNKHVIRY